MDTYRGRGRHWGALGYQNLMVPTNLVHMAIHLGRLALVSDTRAESWRQPCLINWRLPALSAWGVRRTVPDVGHDDEPRQCVARHAHRVRRRRVSHRARDRAAIARRCQGQSTPVGRDGFDRPGYRDRRQ